MVGVGTPSCTGSPGLGFDVYTTGYDGWGRVACETAPSSTVTWAPDGSPDCASSTGHTTFTYRADGQALVTTTATGTTAQGVWGSTFDGLGQVTGTGVDIDADGIVEAETEDLERHTCSPRVASRPPSRPPTTT